MQAAAATEQQMGVLDSGDSGFNLSRGFLPREWGKEVWNRIPSVVCKAAIVPSGKMVQALKYYQTSGVVANWQTSNTLSSLYIICTINITVLHLSIINYENMQSYQVLPDKCLLHGALSTASTLIKAYVLVLSYFRKHTFVPYTENT